MVKTYMLLSKMQVSASPILLLNQIILLISNLLWFFVMNVLIKILIMKNYIREKRIHYSISVFIPIKEDVKNMI